MASGSDSASASHSQLLVKQPLTAEEYYKYCMNKDLVVVEYSVGDKPMWGYFKDVLVELSKVFKDVTFVRADADTLKREASRAKVQAYFPCFTFWKQNKQIKSYRLARKTTAEEVIIFLADALNKVSDNAAGYEADSEGDSPDSENDPESDHESDPESDPESDCEPLYFDPDADYDLTPITMPALKENVVGKQSIILRNDHLLVKPSRCLLIRGVNLSMGPGYLEGCFSHLGIGKVLNSKFIKDPSLEYDNDGEGVVEFESKKVANEMLKKFNGTLMPGPRKVTGGTKIFNMRKI